MLLPTDLLGEWVLRRTLDDRRAGVQGIVTGTTTLTAVGADEVRWDEAGVMTFDGRATPVSRTLTVRRDDDHAWTVHFADGRVFHDWVWGTSVAHACAPDDYTGALDGDEQRWTVRWEARGPAKDYRLDSVLERHGTRQTESMARSSGTEAPRITLTEPVDLQDWVPGPGDVLTGDRIEGKRIGVLDLAGERLPDLEIEECVIDTLRGDGADFRGLRVHDSIIDTLDAPVLRASSSSWREVRVSGGRIGSGELYDSGLNGVEFVGMKFGFVNLRGSTLTDVVFRDCVIDELDIADAKLLRVSFEGSSIRDAEGSNTRIDHVDLRGADLDRVERLEGFRGATIGADQLYTLAPLLAAQAGYRVD